MTRFVLAFATLLPLAAQSADRITGKPFATRSEVIAPQGRKDGQAAGY